ncbi:MAG: HIT family protein [Pseudomonadota bacterium]
MDACPFCEIARNTPPSTAWATDALVVFADHRPIRPGHVQIVTRDHYAVFDELPPALAAEIVMLGQRIARVQKRLYGVRRVGFAFTGNEVAHVHAHVVPLHAADDITSARFTDGTAVLVSEERQAQTARALQQVLEAEDG